MPMLMMVGDRERAEESPSGSVVSRRAVVLVLTLMEEPVSVGRKRKRYGGDHNRHLLLPSMVLLLLPSAQRLETSRDQQAEDVDGCVLDDGIGIGEASGAGEGLRSGPLDRSGSSSEDYY